MQDDGFCYSVNCVSEHNELNEEKLNQASLWLRKKLW